MKPRFSSQLLLYLTLIIIGGSGFFAGLHLPKPVGFYVFITILSLAGLGVVSVIYHTKRAGKQLVCPAGSDCEAVTSSKYSVFLGVSLEYWGIAYFSLIALSYVVRILYPFIYTPTKSFILLLLSLAAGLFSLYLLFIQAFILKKWCIWCILTALLSLSIAITSLIGAPVVLEFLTTMPEIFDVLQSIGFVFGLGGALCASFLFLTFLSDDEISEKELSTIQTVAEIVWIGLGLTLIGLFSEFVVFHEMATDTIFVAQVSALLVSALTGALLMILYAPFMVYIPFGDEASSRTHISSARPVRGTVLGIGAVALISWVFAYGIGFFEMLSYDTLFGGYLALINIALCVALLWHDRLDG